MEKSQMEKAFPVYAPASDVPEYFESGMTLRDYFAAKAMQAFIINAAGFSHITNNAAAAKEAYLAADAMITARTTE